MILGRLTLCALSPAPNPLPACTPRTLSAPRRCSAPSSVQRIMSASSSILLRVLGRQSLRDDLTNIVPTSSTTSIENNQGRPKPALGSARSSRGKEPHLEAIRHPDNDGGIWPPSFRRQEEP